GGVLSGVSPSILLLSAVSLVGASDDLSRARKIFEQAGRAYRKAPALKDTLSYIVDSPNAEHEPKRIEIRLGEGRDVSVADGLLQAVALNDTLYLTKTGAADSYAAGPYSGDFARALEQLAGARSSLFEPPHVAMRTGKNLHYHQGLEPNLTEALEREILEELPREEAR